jgi:hypothetical protein
MKYVRSAALLCSAVVLTAVGLASSTILIHLRQGKGRTTTAEQSATVVYKSRIHRFSLVIPADWQLPPVDDVAPHFGHINRVSGEPDLAFEIERNIAFDQQSIRGLESRNRSEHLEFSVDTRLIAGATVLHSSPAVPAEGWSDEYDIVFDQGPVFTVFGDGDIKETISTLSVY